MKPLLEAMGTTIHHCGGVGTGMRTKLVNNFLAIISCQINAEAIALSQRFGLSLEKTLDVIHGTTATNGQLKIAWPAKVLKGDIEPGFTIDLAHKDLSLIVDAAERGEGAGADRGRGARGVQRRARARATAARTSRRWSTCCATSRRHREAASVAVDPSAATDPLHPERRCSSHKPSLAALGLTSDRS